MKKIVFAAALTATSLTTSSVLAGEFFIGLNAGTSSFTGLNDACNDFLEDNRQIDGFPVTCDITDDSGSILSVNAGYNFNRIFGLEVGYVDLGEYSADFAVPRLSAQATATAEADLTYAAIVLSAPISENFSISGRLGGASANATVSGSASLDSLRLSSTGFAGASLDYRITDNLSVQLRYDNYLDQLEVTTAGIRYYF